MNIKKVRKAAHMTQEELAEKIGVNRATLSKYETGQIEPSLSMLRKICEECDCHLVDMMTNEEMTGVLQRSFSEFEKTLERKKKYDEQTQRESQRIEKEHQQHFNALIKRFVSSTEGRTIIDAFYDLNEYGQKEAVERMIELTFLPQFMKETPEEFEDFVDQYLSERYSVMHQRTSPTEPSETPLDDGNGNSTTK